MSLDELSPAAIGGVVPLVLGAVIILIQRWHGSWTYDSQGGVQNFHSILSRPRVLVAWRLWPAPLLSFIFLM
jgi:hypothetical protein